MKSTLSCTCVALFLSCIATSVLAADVEHIRNDSPQKSPVKVTLEELWRVGGDDGDLIFGAIVEAVADPVGNVYLFDHHMKQVEVISPEGDYLRTLSREGSGPGEVRQPRDMVFLPDGRLGLAELAPSKLVTMSTDGTPSENISLGGDGEPETGFSVTITCDYRGDTFLLGGQFSIPNEVGQARTQFLSILTETGTEAHRLREATTVLNFVNPAFSEQGLIPPFFFATTVGPDGRVYVPVDRDSYAIEVYNAEGVLEKIIEREYKNRKRTKNETKRLETLFSSLAAGFPGELKLDIEPRNQAVSGMFVDQKNRLWVKHAGSGDNLPEGVFLSFDLFDAQGRYLHEVHIYADGNAAYDDLEFLPDGRVLLIKGYILAQWETFDTTAINWDEGEDSGAMEIICCRLNL
jgi:hypothetical protein